MCSGPPFPAPIGFPMGPDGRPIGNPMGVHGLLWAPHGRRMGAMVLPWIAMGAPWAPQGRPMGTQVYFVIFYLFLLYFDIFYCILIYFCYISIILY